MHFVTMSCHLGLKRNFKSFVVCTLVMGSFGPLCPWYDVLMKCKRHSTICFFFFRQASLRVSHTRSSQDHFCWHFHISFSRETLNDWCSWCYERSSHNNSQHAFKKKKNYAWFLLENHFEERIFGLIIQSTVYGLPAYSLPVYSLQAKYDIG